MVTTGFEFEGKQPRLTKTDRHTTNLPAEESFLLLSNYGDWESGQQICSWCFNRFGLGSNVFVRNGKCLFYKHSSLSVDLLGHKLILFFLSSNFKEGIKGGSWCRIIKVPVAVYTTTPQSIIHCRIEKMEFQREHNKVNGCSRSLEILLNKKLVKSMLIHVSSGKLKLLMQCQAASIRVFEIWHLMLLWLQVLVSKR